MVQLTLQLYSAGQWLDAMTLAFPEPEKGLDGPCRFGYKQDICWIIWAPSTVLSPHR